MNIIKIILNLALAIIGVMGLIVILVGDISIGLAMMIIAILFYMLSKLTDISEEIERISPTVVAVNPPLPKPEPKAEPIKEVPKPEPKAEPIKEVPKPEPFKCKKCNKEFADKKKLQRHIGMAHYADLET